MLLSPCVKLLIFILLPKTSTVKIWWAQYFSRHHIVVTVLKAFSPCYWICVGSVFYFTKTTTLCFSVRNQFITNLLSPEIVPVQSTVCFIIFWSLSFVCPTFVFVLRLKVKLYGLIFSFIPIRQKEKSVSVHSCYTPHFYRCLKLNILVDFSGKTKQNITQNSTLLKLSRKIWSRLTPVQLRSWQGYISVKL